MPIPDAETRALNEEIEKLVFRKAFIELAVVFARRDRKGFEGAARTVKAAVEQVSVKHVVPPGSVQAKTVDLELIHQQGLGNALMSYNTAVREILNRIG
ncbi:MAG: hypothetical protein ACK4U0_17325 [Mesorhizobium sp.]